MSEHAEIGRLEQQLQDRLREIGDGAELLAQAIPDVIYYGRRAERKLWREYRRAAPPLDPEKLDAQESWSEGEALHAALDDLEEVFANTANLMKPRGFKATPFSQIPRESLADWSPVELHATVREALLRMSEIMSGAKPNERDWDSLRYARAANNEIFYRGEESGN